MILIRTKKRGLLTEGPFHFVSTKNSAYKHKISRQDLKTIYRQKDF